MICKLSLLILLAAYASMARADEKSSAPTADPEVPRGLRHLARRIEADLVGKP